MFSKAGLRGVYFASALLGRLLVKAKTTAGMTPIIEMIESAKNVSWNPPVLACA